MKKKKVHRVALLVLLLVGAGWYLEGPGVHPPGWWKTSTYWPLASGPVRWRLVAPVLKLAGSLPELGWGELWTYFKNFSGSCSALIRSASASGWI